MYTRDWLATPLIISVASGAPLAGAYRGEPKAEVPPLDDEYVDRSLSPIGPGPL
ncbi:hypothetical protein BDM02DRAFT_3120269 [Thelephora ganbajun]|uniref:Uncharacterized protein n=1 Tax=Thelephora ganbajun TaxID=370292 RepID=A0ACB6Z809_THEGA|nr:hypothetical protein BDM02DRAFT_3120269 [Thelephora ganbajun]